MLSLPAFAAALCVALSLFGAGSAAAGALLPAACSAPSVKDPAGKEWTGQSVHKIGIVAYPSDTTANSDGLNVFELPDEQATSVSSDFRRPMGFRSGMAGGYVATPDTLRQCRARFLVRPDGTIHETRIVGQYCPIRNG